MSACRKGLCVFKTTILFLFSKMGFGRWQVLRVFTAVFLLLFCGELAYKVGSDTLLKVANFGDNITLTCHPLRGINACWNRDGSWLACSHESNNISRITESYTAYLSTNTSLYTLSISDVTIGDSGTYKCYDSSLVQSYDVQIVRCSCSVKDHANLNKKKIICELENYWTSNTLRTNITVNDNVTETAMISGDTFSFSTPLETLYNDFQFELNLSTDVSLIRCMLPAQFTSPNPSTRHTSTSLIPTTSRRLNNRSTASQIHSHKLSSGTPYPTTNDFTLQNNNSGQDNSRGKGNFTIIFVILGSGFLMILIVIVIVLRCKKTKDLQKGKPDRNLSSDNQVEAEDHPQADYEQIEDGWKTEAEHATSSEMLTRNNKDGKDDSSIDVSTANVHHDYMALIPTSSRSTESETTDNQTRDMAEYVNSSIRDQPKWKGVSPKPEDQYDDVSISEIRD